MATIFICDWLTGSAANGHSFNVTDIWICMNSSWTQRTRLAKHEATPQGYLADKDMMYKVTKPEVINCFPERARTEFHIM